MSGGKPKGKPVSADGQVLYECGNCGKIWKEKELSDSLAKHVWNRFEDGDIFSHYECPDDECCGALVLPVHGDPIVILRQDNPESPLQKHLLHTMLISSVNNYIALVCCTCGDEGTYVMTDKEIKSHNEAQ